MHVRTGGRTGADGWTDGYGRVDGRVCMHVRTGGRMCVRTSVRARACEFMLTCLHVCACVCTYQDFFTVFFSYSLVFLFKQPQPYKL